MLILTKDNCSKALKFMDENWVPDVPERQYLDALKTALVYMELADRRLEALKTATWANDGYTKGIDATIRTAIELTPDQIKKEIFDGK